MDNRERASALIEELETLQPDLYGKDFLLTWENCFDNLKAVMLTAEILQCLHKEKKPWRIFDYGLAISIFRDNSTRTRFSFASAVNGLGLALAELDEVKSQIAHGETVRETANMISFLTEVIGIRDDMYPGEGHSYMLEVAQAVSDGYIQGVLAQRPTIVNLQCDLDHPTQVLSDLLKLKDYFGGWENLKGKKLAMSWAYSPSYGKPLSVPQGVINLMTRFGMNVVLAHPEGYNLLPETLKSAAFFAQESGGSFAQTHYMEEAFKDADVVYPKSWAPLAVMQERTELLRIGNKQGLQELEQLCLANNERFIDWECDEEMMKLTKNGEALYEHCLPADISDVSCERGEVSQSVFERYRYHTYQEAGYKPFVIAAMILNSKVQNPVAKLKSFL
ncbi:MAG TPA: knotted carbamoyltransferase YgeW [Candidatus Cloacimonas sp.]|jgi:knotted carbamoyltransferase YgeW|nr:knotted carbamoyltransferase YgeW [Candidatus Cloacimonas sp.]MDD2251198.1 knotted carbamoyltransferase YgeW [Candidatus Cloacimonadota bacterium]MCK9165406.1 knotted carbamoyltransferase YgeW [Candidatus Cloacimonas sp.]MDD3869350.1 knotted carbamoyltransferase YgeW [Candidatus Cloacimonadota bacterium]MDD4676719.1 knotted carbamoyltransferase YgeW [Candidatus Cloacimonadota bacterium]